MNNINCLSYALRFNKLYPEYKIYYNSYHCVNLPEGSVLQGFLLIEEFGYDYFYRWYENNLITEEDLFLLKEYFNLHSY